MAKGHIKGGNFEREVCSILSAWAGCRETRQELLPFRRRSTNVQPIDGLWRGGSDIMAKADMRWPFAVEAKKDESWSMDQLFRGDGPVMNWWDQAVDNGVRHKLFPMLVFSRNKAPVYFMLEESLCQKLQRKNSEGKFRQSRSLLPLLRVVDRRGQVAGVGVIGDLITTVPFASVQTLRK